MALGLRLRGNRHASHATLGGARASRPRTAHIDLEPQCQYLSLDQLLVSDKRTKLVGILLPIA
jgi:hypothetical protein